MSLSQILQVSKAVPRKGTARNFKKGSTKILTDTPVRNAITDARAQRHQKKSMTTAKKILFNKSRRQAAQEEADDETSSNQESEIEYNDFTDAAAYSGPIRFQTGTSTELLAHRM